MTWSLVLVLKYIKAMPIHPLLSLSHPPVMLYQRLQVVELLDNGSLSSLCMAAGFSGQVEEEAVEVLVGGLGQDVVATHPGSACRHQQHVAREAAAVQP